MKKFELKQVILVRTDLKMPKGKLAAQVAHASVDAVLNSKKKIVKLWKSQGMKKVCLKVNSLDELLKFVDAAQINSLQIAIITDAGKTFFKESTTTCAAIGPNFSNKIDVITKDLKML
jgi:PTH2 family peptidyl-tRNA hydrolase